MWSLTALAIAAGVAMLWAFDRFSDQARIREAKRKLRAHLYAFRLFADEPALIFRAQKHLLAWNARYLALMLRPTAIILVPMVALLVHLDAVYGRRALRPGEAALVIARTAGDTGRPALEGRGVAVETPPVRVPGQHRAYWRVRAGSGSGSVLLRLGDATLVKTVQTGTGLRYLSERRVSSLFDWLRFPAEARLPAGPVRWIEVAYPSAEVDVFGWQVHWLIWFFAVSLLTALALRKRLGVVF